MKSIHSQSLNLKSILSCVVFLAATGCSSTPLEAAPAKSGAPANASETAAQWSDDGEDDWGSDESESSDWGDDEPNSSDWGDEDEPNSSDWGGSSSSGVITSPPSVRAVQDANATANNWGCDTDTAFLNMSASQWGACCDYHDECFERYDCTASSWLGGSADCTRCNQEVVTCMTRSPGPGPSLCTKPENGRACGTYRSGPK